MNFHGGNVECFPLLCPFVTLQSWLLSNVEDHTLNIINNSRKIIGIGNAIDNVSKLKNSNVYFVFVSLLFQVTREPLIMS